MDEVDLANENAERELTLVLRSMRAPTRPTNYDGDWCLICGDEIPPARQNAMPGCCTCITCQERLGKGYSR